jgi:hypothetical protein
MRASGAVGAVPEAIAETLGNSADEPYGKADFAERPRATMSIPLSSAPSCKRRKNSMRRSDGKSRVFTEFS